MELSGHTDGHICKWSSLCVCVCTYMYVSTYMCIHILTYISIHTQVYLLCLLGGPRSDDSPVSVHLAPRAWVPVKGSRVPWRNGRFWDGQETHKVSLENPVVPESKKETDDDKVDTHWRQ